MDNSKAPLNLSVREPVWRGLKDVAERERRKESEITELILEWSVAHLVEVGSLNRLLGCRIHLPGGFSRPPEVTKG